MPLSRWLVPACLISFFLFTSAALAQSKPGGTNSQKLTTNGAASYLQPLNPTLKADQTGNYLQPYTSSLESDQVGIKGSNKGQRHQSPQTQSMSTANKPNANIGTAKSTGSLNSAFKSGYTGSALGKNRGTATQGAGLQITSVGSLSPTRGTMASKGSGSSFLDGYLLRSLQEKSIGRKRGTK